MDAWRMSKAVGLRAAMTILFALSLWRYITHKEAHDISEYQTFINPSSSTFDIWIVIYAWLGAFLIRAWMPTTHEIPPYMSMLYMLFTVAFAIDIIWMEVRAGGYTKQAAIPLALLWIVVTAAYVVVEHHMEPVVVTSLLVTSREHVYTNASAVDLAWIRAPFTLWWAWVSAEAVLALVELFEDVARHEVGLYVAALGVYSVVSAAFLLTMGDLIIAVVALWFLWGIGEANRHQQQDTETRNAVGAMASLAIFMHVGLLALLAIHKGWRGPKTQHAPGLRLSGSQAPYQPLE
ncbi:hypothetical protein AC1031_007630 [Aphanomyces cochlioides]|nr:hypothetical protein AC1031_007630 [Aphanomyces cochlioides]